MGQAVPIRTDYTASEVRRFAKCAKDGAQARRLLALAAVLDGVSRCTPQVVTISTVGSGRCSAPSDLLDRKGARQITEAAHEAASDSSIPVWRW